MKFKSRTDPFFVFILLGVAVFLIGLAIFMLFVEKRSLKEAWVVIPLLGIAAWLLWIYFGTRYELTKTDLIYKSGPIRGSIKIERIREIEKDKTLWVGMKPATARNGLIIKYDKFNEIYISPKTNDTFVQKIAELNREIKIKSG